MAKKPKKSTVKNKLDKLIGDYFRNRSCEAHGYDIDCSEQIQWCHIKSRRYLSVRWDRDNAVSMCAAHHRYYTDNPTNFTYFLLDEKPNKLYRLDEKFKKVSPMRVNDMIELYDRLVEEIKDWDKLDEED